MTRPINRLTVFCKLCGGPLESVRLIATSTASETWQNNNPRVMTDDTCDCNAPPEYDHQPWCAVFVGYSGGMLKSYSIKWLDTCRLIYRTRGRSAAESRVRVTEKGSITKRQATTLNVSSPRWFPKDRNGQPMWVTYDARPVHDACWKILNEVHHWHYPHEALNVEGLWELMGDDTRNTIDILVRDVPSYDVRRRQAYKRSCRGWRPTFGKEWLVADPTRLSTLTHEDLRPPPAPSHTKGRPGHDNADPDPNDPLRRFPNELIYKLLEFLPARDVANLASASPKLLACFRDVPPSFWRARFSEYLPWVQQEVLDEAVQKFGTRFYNPANFRWVSQASRKPRGIHASERRRLLPLANRARIWQGCERILEYMRRAPAREQENGDH